ncbi:MAG: hypothetical protein M3Y56_04780 [Armatimonadota bacterium]|nr:hypothetical protein [Armatimonadota bacterium]
MIIQYPLLTNGRPTVLPSHGLGMPFRVALLSLAFAVYMALQPAWADPLVQSDRLLVGIELPGLPPDASATLSVDGHAAAAIKGPLENAFATLRTLSEGAHTVSLTVPDPKNPLKPLYSGSLPILRKNPAAAPGPGDLPDRIIFTLNAPVPTTIPAKNIPDKPEWDKGQGLPADLLSANYPQGDLDASVELQGAAAPLPAELPEGMKGLRVVVKLSNRSNVPEHVLSSGLRLSNGNTDAYARFFVLPSSVLPAIIPPGGDAALSFRLDTFNDTPPGRYTIQPVIVSARAAEDLLADGGFETPKPLVKPTTPPAVGWTLPADAPAGNGAATVKAGAPLSNLADRIADWKDFSKLTFANDNLTATQGSGLLAATGSGTVAETRVTSLTPGEHYLAGVEGWNGDRFRLDVLGKDGKSLGSSERTISTYWFGRPIANWRGRTLTFGVPKGAASLKLSLLAGADKSWWDNAFLLPLPSLRKALSTPLSFTIAGSEAARTGDVVYLGEDRDTKGDWIGKYGQYAWILSGMSAPEDMVGGEVKPIKSDYPAMTLAYNNETIRVRGTRELRYTAWTGDPGDILPRHWISAMRTDDNRAPDNPQWGHRTAASWDDHAEVHPGDAWGGDLYVRLRMPAGTWKVSYFFQDWDWAGAPYPRDYRLQFQDGQGRELCTGRVSHFGDGVYKVFRVEGGKDLTLRIRKDFSINSIISGIFVDRMTPAHGPAVEAAVNGDAAVKLTAAVKQWKEAAASVDGFDAETTAIKDYANIAAGKSPADAAKLLNDLGDQWFADGEYWRAGLAYDNEPPVGKSTPLELEQGTEARAVQFRSVFPRYAEDKLRQAIADLSPLPAADRVAEVKHLAKRLFDVAIKDHTDSHGLERLPMLLPKLAFSELEKESGGYIKLTATERAKMLAVVERLTWYDMGWDDVANEATRLWPTLTEKQRKELGPSFFADHVVRPYGVLAQQDHSYVEKTQVLVDDFVKANPETDDAAFAEYALAEMYYQQGQTDHARKLCEKIAAEGGKTRPDILSKMLLVTINGKEK